MFFQKGILFVPSKYSKNGKLGRHEVIFSKHFQDKTWNFELKKKQYSKDKKCANITHNYEEQTSHDVEQSKSQKNKYDDSIYIK